MVFDRVSMICIARGETANNPLGRDSLPGPDDHFILAGLIGGQNALPCHDQITPDSPVDAPFAILGVRQTELRVTNGRGEVLGRRGNG